MSHSHPLHDRDARGDGPGSTRAAPRVWALVPAAGSGRRLGAAVPKQYLEVAGQPLLTHTLRALAATPELAGMVVVVAAGDSRWRDCVPSGVEVWSAPGGVSRMQSVRHGLDALADRAADDDWVLVHDAARPCVSRGEIGSLLEAVHEHPVGGLLAIPVTDTLKRARADHIRTVAQTVSRDHLWHALTPQAFRIGLLRRCLSEAAASGRQATDEAEAVEWAGHAPLLVPGAAANIKVTVAADLALAERWLAAGAPDP